jgi:site-specific DNA recombinase
MANTPVRRCAAYTRKSSEEGLDQDYNSLHAQREACEAFIMSQAGEGWRLMKAAYDDGGYSGGTMERPALQKLLANIHERMIDVVVVYKVRQTHPFTWRFRANSRAVRRRRRLVRGGHPAV